MPLVTIALSTISIPEVPTVAPVVPTGAATPFPASLLDTIPSTSVRAVSSIDTV